jgi:hypothetical protein
VCPVAGGDVAMPVRSRACAACARVVTSARRLAARTRVRLRVRLLRCCAAARCAQCVVRWARDVVCACSRRVLTAPTAWRARAFTPISHVSIPGCCNRLVVFMLAIALCVYGRLSHGAPLSRADPAPTPFPGAPPPAPAAATNAPSVCDVL